MTAARRRTGSVGVRLDVSFPLQPTRCESIRLRCGSIARTETNEQAHVLVQVILELALVDGMGRNEDECC